MEENKGLSDGQKSAIIFVGGLVLFVYLVSSTKILSFGGKYGK